MDSDLKSIEVIFIESCRLSGDAACQCQEESVISLRIQNGSARVRCQNDGNFGSPVSVTEIAAFDGFWQFQFLGTGLS